MLRRLVMGALFVGAVALAGAVGWARQMRPVDEAGPGRSVSLTVEQGATAQSIAEKLEAEGLIRNRAMWVLAASQEGYTQKFQAGDFQLSTTMSAVEIMEALTHGTVATISLTVPEGKKLDQIARIVAETKLCTATEFADLARDPARWPKTSFPLPADSLEGYLFPDTYPVDRDATAEEILEQMLARFGQTYDKHRSDIEASPMSLHEIVTLASIIENEIKVPEERPIAAQIFLSRLEQGMMLQSCATVQYLFDEPKEQLLYADLEIDSPYNTYKRTGLPPGPISSPGESCIEAVLHPAETDYLFFHTQEGSDRHTFSRTTAEHEATKDRY